MPSNSHHSSLPSIGSFDSIPILISTAAPSLISNDNKKKNMKGKNIYQSPTKESNMNRSEMMDFSGSTLGGDIEDAPERKFMKGLEESLLNNYESSEESSSYWSSSSDDEENYSEEEESDSDDNEATDSDGSLGEENSAPHFRNHKKHKRSTSTLSLDALLQVQMQLGDAKKPAPKFVDKGAVRRGRRLNKEHNPTSLGALARKVGSGTATSKELPMPELTTFCRSESATLLPKPKKLLHYQQAGSVQDNEPPPLVGMRPLSPKRHSPRSKAVTATPVVAVTKPRDHYLKILENAGIAAPLVPYDRLMGVFFAPVTAEDKAAFDMELVGTVRNRNLEQLQALHQRGHPVQARSQFGESLVHICARRGTPEMLRFLLAQNATCHVCCDYGRTPLHDAAWSTDAVSLEMMKILIGECPDLLLVLDKRGFMPLDYIPKERWAQCCAFLDKHKDMLMPTGIMFGDSDSSDESYDSESGSSEEESSGYEDSSSEEEGEY